MLLGIAVPFLLADRPAKAKVADRRGKRTSGEQLGQR